MTKQILIVGGGISGLSLLHNLKKKYVGRSDIQIRLIEKDNQVGGTARTVFRNQLCFEHGPNGFLEGAGEHTLTLAKDIGLENELVPANREAKKRFISIKNNLYQLPASPLDFFSFQLLTPLDKFRLLLEGFIRKGKNSEESVYNFAVRRFGEKVARYLIDPMVSGIFGGDAQALNMKLAFPKIYELEQTYGSLFFGLMRRKRQKKKFSQEGQPEQPPKAGRLYSFNKGMGQLCDAILHQYEDSINRGEEVKCIDRAGEGYSVETDKLKYYADELFLCAPAYITSELTKDLDAVLAELLGKIHYAPIAVAGLVYPKAAFSRLPQGYGYLIPSTEEKEVLGVLFPSNIFPNRTDKDHFMFRVMVGGVRNGQILEESKENILKLAEIEVKTAFNINQPFIDHFFVMWPKAIPQYDQEYIHLREGILYELQKFDKLHLVANYLDGISFNDCTHNAFLAAERSSF